MAYGRTTLKRRMTYGRGTRRYRQTVYRRAYYQRRRGVGRKEKKGVDVPFPEDSLVASTNTNQGIYLLNGIQEGVGSWNRVGRYTWNKSIELDLNLQMSTQTAALDTAVTAAQWVRCVLVWDKAPNNGTIPTFDTIFGQTSQTGVESVSVNDHLRYDNMFRFKVLLDTQINPMITASSNQTTTGPASASVATNTLVRYHKFLKLGNKMTNYSGTANPVTTANISTGALYLVLRTPEEGLQDFWTLKNSSTARLRYVD